MRTWSKSCPKCLGDLREEVSVYDTYVFCASCRYTLTQREKDALFALTAAQPLKNEPRSERPSVHG